MIYENFPLDIRPVADFTAIFSILVGENGRKCERTWLSAAKIPLYYTETLRDKWGVFSHVILYAEFDSGLKIRILCIFDPKNPLFGSKNGPI